MNINDRTINPLLSRSISFHQSENASLSYTIDYAAYLGTDTIATSTWISRQSLTIMPSSTTTTATAKVTGSAGRYTLVNKITTTSGNVDERMIKLTITQNDELPIAGDYE
jgi:hypothetical protein